MALTKRITLQIPQGATYRHEFLYKNLSDNTPVDITLYTARMHFREYVDAPTTLYAATSATGEFEIDGPAGKVTLTIGAAVTELFAFTDAVFDLEIVSPTGVVVRLVKGTVKVDPEVTR